MVAAAALIVAVVIGLTAWAVRSGSSPRATSAATATPSSAPSAVTTPGAPVGGTPAPGFTLQTLDGRPVSLAQLAGHPVLVNFWASWCAECRHEFPLLAAAQQQHHAQGLVIVGIASQDIASDARSFAQHEHARWTLLFDTDNTVSGAYGVRALPQTFFIRRDGTIASRLFGLTSQHELEGDLRGILG
ncbi:MAG TPA: redoxin domain-containing protein [Acidimicrobiia bacterium]|nr:redoxin domain-containing protein [Acidimicrobiia bacterium]